MMPTNATIRRTLRRLIPGALVGVLSLVTLGFLIATVFLAFLEVMPAPLATLSTAVVSALVTGILIAVNRALRKRRRRLTTGGLMDELMPALHLAVGRKPWATFAAAAILGAVTEIATKNGAPRQPRD